MLAGVRYVLFWNGGSVEKVIARVILTDVVYNQPSGDFKLKQLFELEWNYNNQIFADIIAMQNYDNLINSVSYYSQKKSGTLGF